MGTGMKRILVTGACGSVGSAIVKRMLDSGHVVCCFDHDEDKIFRLQRAFEGSDRRERLRFFIGSVRDLERLTLAFDSVDVVYHCAALKHVHLSELNSFEAVETNIAGTHNVVKAATAAKVKTVVFTSSDKAVNPTSMMGATKLVAERLVTSANYTIGSGCTVFVTVRFGNVLNTNGSVVPIFRSQLASGKPLTLTSTDMTRFFITMNDAVDLCCYAADHAIGGEIYVQNMRAASLSQLARVLNNGVTPELDIIGPKPGEKLYEELITDVEASRTFREDGYIFIEPDEVRLLGDSKREAFVCRTAKCEVYGDAVRSDTDLMSDAALESLIARSLAEQD